MKTVRSRRVSEPQKLPKSADKHFYRTFFYQSEANWVQKSYFYENLRLQDYLLTRLPTTSILVVWRRIYCYQSECNRLKKQKTFWKKKKASYLKYFWNYWLGKTWLLKWVKGPVCEKPSAVNVLKEKKLRNSVFFTHPIWFL